MLQKQGHMVSDFGTFSLESADYPDFAHAVSEAVENGQAERGVLLCGSGDGVGRHGQQTPGHPLRGLLDGRTGRAGPAA